MAVSTAESSVSAKTALSLIDGKWTAGSGEEHEIRHPANGDLIATASYCTKADVDAAVAAAVAAKRAWAETPLYDRCERISAVAKVVEDNAEELAQITTAETGKTINEARGEIIGTVKYFRIIPEEALRFDGKVVPPTFNTAKNKRVLITPVPIGVTALMTPWNFPTAVPCEGFAAGLVMGNAVLWKPSEQTPATSQMLVEMIIEGADLPAGVFSLIQGAGETGAAIVEHPDVGLIHFTGSTDTGERIAKAAGVKRLLLELGGNGPVIVLDDADLDAAVEGVVGSAFLVAGQCCTAAERVLVHRDIHDEFVSRLVKAVESMKVGDPFDESTQMGSCTVQSSVDKTRQHLDDAVAKGAEVATGGKEDGLFFEPTVITGVTPDMEIAQEETFGPVAPIIKFSSEDEATEIANGTRYGLQAAIFSGDLARGWRLAETIECGTVAINEMTNYWEFLAPFGGMKKSGVGRVSGTGALEGYTDQKQILLDLD